MSRRFAASVSLAVLSLIAVGFAVVASHWPFRRASAADSLGDSLASTIVFGTFRQTYFPWPGFLAADVKIVSRQGAAGYAEIAKLESRATWAGLFAHRIRRITADGLTISVRSLGERPFVGHAGKNTIGEIDLRRAVLQIGPASDARRFDFHEVLLHNVAAGRQIGYQITVAIPQPTGELELHGQLGPLKSGEFAQTPLAGSYRLSQANLGVFGGIGGLLSSQGSYSGVLSRLNVQGDTDSPNFAVRESGHTHHLTARFQAMVNAMNGDTKLPRVSAIFDGTSLQIANTTIASTGEEMAKSVSLDLSGRGRIQDLMLLFIKARRSPILGPVGFRAHVVLPPDGRSFKQRVFLNGDFGIAGAGFTEPKTQAGVDTLSKQAEGESHDAPERVLSDLRGHVALRDGIATFTNLSFSAPGAAANLSGTFSLITERIDLRGKLATEAELSKTSTGIKSAFLKLFDPVFKRRHAGAVIPVSLDGTYGNPRFHEVFTKGSASGRRSK